MTIVPGIVNTDSNFTLTAAQMTSAGQSITQLLGNARAGNGEAVGQLMEVVHAHLLRMAQRQMQLERNQLTLQPTVLVNEAYLELFAGQQPDWADRNHFFAYAASVMRNIVIRHARRRTAQKRGGGLLRVTLTGLAQEQSAEELLALDEALSKLAQFDQRKSRMIELRFFGGLSIEELGTVMDLAPSTVHRELKSARGWLFSQMESE